MKYLVKVMGQTGFGNVAKELITPKEPKEIINEYIRAIPFTKKEWEELQKKLNIQLKNFDDKENFKKICKAMNLKDDEIEIVEIAHKLKKEHVVSDDEYYEFIENFGDFMIYEDADGKGAGANTMQSGYFGIYEWPTGWIITEEWEEI